MGLNIKLDDEALGTLGKGLYQILGLQPPDDGATPPVDSSLAGDPNSAGNADQRIPTKLGRLKEIMAASQGQAAHPELTDGFNGPGNPQPPAGNFVMQDAGGPDAGAQPSINPGPGEVLPPAPRSLAQIMQSPAVNQFVDASQGNNTYPPAAADMAPPGASAAGAQPTAPEQKSWAQEHPGLAKILKIGLGAGQGAAAGAGSMTFGEGYERGAILPVQIQTARLANAKTKAQIADTNSQVGLRNAQTSALTNGKIGAAQLEFDKGGNLIGFRDQRGNLIGPNNPNLTPDMKAMLDAAKGRATKEGTPESQAMAYWVSNGKSPAEAYQLLQDSKQSSKPDTAAQTKQEYMRIIGKLTAETGNKIDPGILTDPRKTAAAISGSRTLSDAEKQSALSYIATNTTPANQILLGNERGASYGATRQYSVLDTRNGNRPGYVSADELNRANREEPGRYLASGPGATALNKENLMEDIRGGIQQVRDALNNPNMPDFTAKQKVKLAVAMRERNPQSAISSLITAGDLGTMTPEQEDYLIAHAMLAENAMAMRSVLGAGQGSQDLRAAITNTFPGPTTPSKAYGLKQLGVFEKTIDRLERGIPTVPLKDIQNGGNQGGNNSNSLAGEVKPGEPTASGPGGHTIVFRSGKWVDPTNGTEVK